MQQISIIGVLFLAHYCSAPPLNTSALTTTSTTMTSLPDITNHGDPKLICTPATWLTVASFFLGNYVAHAGTTHIFPGEILSQQLLAMVTSLLYPGAGVVRGLTGIARGILVRARETELQKAGAAGALCMVVRTQDWTPPPQLCSVRGVRNRSSVRGVRSWQVDTMQPVQFFPGWLLVDTLQSTGTFGMFREIHGGHKDQLPKGYTYASVPPDAVIDPDILDSTVHLAKSFNTAKIMVAIFQTIYSVYSLYQSRGDQIQHFGSGSFSLTVTPYAVMSIINLFSGLLSPTYPAVFLVRSEVLAEIEARDHHGKWFAGTVGSLRPLDSEDNCPTMLVGQGDDHPNYMDSVVILRSDPASGEDLDTLKIPAFPPFEHVQPIVPAAWTARFTSHPHLRREGVPAEFEDLLWSLKFFIPLSIFIGSVLPFLIIFGLSRHARGGNMRAQLVWVKLWLWFGGTIGVYMPILTIPLRLSMGGLLTILGQPFLEFLERFGVRTTITQVKFWVLEVFVRLAYCAPAIGGFVVVAQMIRSYGDCRRL